MILYYSGTGNSEYVAKRIAGVTGDECLNLFDRLQRNDIREIHSERPFVAVSPTYAWQLPHIVRDWLSWVKLTGAKDIYFVLTCGGDIGNAGEYAAKLSAKIGLRYRGCGEIVMPENYIAMFGAPDEAEALAIVGKAEPAIDAVAVCIADGCDLPERKITAVDRLKSGPVNAAFYPAYVHARKFRISAACIGCGRCARGCVMNNITIKNSKPSWGDSCTHCMACICSCPASAIEYGDASVGKPRYRCPVKTGDDPKRVRPQ